VKEQYEEKGKAALELRNKPARNGRKIKQNRQRKRIGKYKKKT